VNQARPPHRHPGDIRGRLVRIAFLVRLLTLAYGVLALAPHDGRLAVAVLLAVLGLTSHLGLQYERVRRLVVRHPAVALPDLVLVTAIPFVVGIHSPLTLVALSSALLVGVLVPVRTAVPLAVLLAVPPGLAALLQLQESMTAALRTPVELVALVALGSGVRRMAEQQRLAEERASTALQAATAVRERLRLARDLHDTVAKSVQGVALVAAALPHWIERDPARARDLAGTVVTGARQAVTAARDLLTAMRLDDPGRPLHVVVGELVCRWEADAGVAVERRIEEVPQLSPAARHELVLALAEALENVRRHAAGSAVQVSLDAVGDAVVVTVADSGPGFDDARRDEAFAAGHFGLAGITERLESAGGDATIVSVEGRGTTVRLRVPLDGSVQTGTVAAVDAGPPGNVRQLQRWSRATTPASERRYGARPAPGSQAEEASA
jgi:signal transduction histidine kinase